MKKIIVNEEWCLGCHLCEYECAFANSVTKLRNETNDIAKLLKGKTIYPNIKIEDGTEDGKKINFAVSCRHCDYPYCAKSCINGCLTVLSDGTVKYDKDKCVGCYTCVVACPYGCILPNEGNTVRKCELCLNNQVGKPACVKHCPNAAIVYEEVEESKV
ncbi:MAG: 4Fe-4S binding protein [Ruminococcus sp.]|jgi:carbon-monoxide dehydrogenase iron sulfur subunit|nr:4Fe-4S binding protein [Ruminococcus sp.]